MENITCWFPSIIPSVLIHFPIIIDSCLTFLSDYRSSLFNIDWFRYFWDFQTVLIGRSFACSCLFFLLSRVSENCFAVFGHTNQFPLISCIDFQTLKYEPTIDWLPAFIPKRYRWPHFIICKSAELRLLVCTLIRDIDFKPQNVNFSTLQRRSLSDLLITDDW